MSGEDEQAMISVGFQHDTCRFVAQIKTAVDENDILTIRVLAEQGADFNAPDDEGIPPLYRAVDYGYVDMVRALYEQGADLDLLVFAWYLSHAYSCRKRSCGGCQTIA